MNEGKARRIWEKLAVSREQASREELVRLAVQYAQIRVEWALSSREDRLAIDQRRTSMHNALIDACKILSRRMRGAGEDNAWRAILGEDRREIGDFACWLHCFLGLEAR